MFGKWDTTFTDFEMIFCLCRRPGCSIWEVPKGLTTEKHWTESKWPASREGDTTGLNWVPNGGEKMPNTGPNCLMISGLKSTTQLPQKTLLLRYYETNALTSLSYSRALGSMRTGGGGVPETLRWYEDHRTWFARSACNAFLKYLCGSPLLFMSLHECHLFMKSVLHLFSFLKNHAAAHSLCPVFYQHLAEVLPPGVLLKYSMTFMQMVQSSGSHELNCG